MSEIYNELKSTLAPNGKSLTNGFLKLGWGNMARAINLWVLATPMHARWLVNLSWFYRYWAGFEFANTRG